VKKCNSWRSRNEEEPASKETILTLIDVGVGPRGLIFFKYRYLISQKFTEGKI
jgi:hypothetical protein